MFGFKATLNLFGGNSNEKEFSELASDTFVTGAYKVHREDSYGYGSQDTLKARIPKPHLKAAKSTNDLVLPQTTNPNVRNSSPVISRDPRGAEQADQTSAQTSKQIKNQEKIQKQLDKQRLADQKKQAKEQAKQEKLIKDRLQKEAKKDNSTCFKKKQAPQPQQQPQNQPRNQPKSKAPKHPQPDIRSQTQAPPSRSSPTNTIDSSISKTSGPPPYSEVPKPTSKDKSNVTYSKPVDTGSWDIISQHREQISRPAAAVSDGKRKQVVMDLNYNFDDNNKENSEA